MRSNDVSHNRKVGRRGRDPAPRSPFVGKKAVKPVFDPLAIPPDLKRAKKPGPKPKGVDLPVSTTPTLVSSAPADPFFGYAPNARAGMLAAKAEKKSEAAVVDAQAIMRRKAGNIFAELDGMMDDSTIELGEFSLYDWLRQRMIPPQIARMLIRRFEPIRDELVEAMEGKDKQLKEGYRRMKYDAVEELAALYQDMIDDIEKYVDVERKKSAAKAKPRKVSIERILKGVSFAKTNEKLKLASIDPAKVIGSAELWTYNPATNVLMVYRSAKGLTFKGCNIININEETSFGKKLGHGAEAKLRAVLDGGKIAARKLLEDLPGDKIVPARLSHVTILLKYFLV